MWTAGGPLAFTWRRHTAAMTRPATTLDNIERVAAPEPDELDRRYVRTGTPVVLTGLVTGTDAARFADPAVARAELGHLPLPAVPRPEAGGPGSASRPDPGTPPRTLAFTELYDGLRLGTGRWRLAPDHATPPPLAAALPPPYLDLGMPQDPWLSHMFLSGPGDVTALCYDRDLRTAVVVQVFGRQRFLLVDPAGAAAPTWECVLAAGESLLVPAAFWHQRAGLEVSLAVGFRLRHIRYLERLAAWVRYPNVALLPLAAAFRDDRAVPRWALDAFAALIGPV
jgi:hypothetical protein